MQSSRANRQSEATPAAPSAGVPTAPGDSEDDVTGVAGANGVNSATPLSQPIRRSHLPTMQDIAAAAGVNQSTVSRVLTGSPNPIPINPSTRQRVIDAAREMGYRPNPLARGLRGSKTMLLGVIVREIADPFFAGAIDAISTEANRRGYNVVLGHAHGQADEAIALRVVLETRYCDAIILLGDTSDQPRLVEDLRATDITVVGVNQGSSSLSGIKTVNVDNRLGIRALLDHLIELGHRSFGFIGGSFSFSGGRLLGDISERQRAFTESLTTLGMNTAPEYCQDAQNDFSGGAAGFEALMALPDRPTAVVASTDVLAFGALRAAHKLGLRVPEDISIVGFDDLPLAEYTTPPLTTVCQPISEMAAAAVRAAIDEPGAEATPLVEILKPTLLIRESSGPAPAHRGRVPVS